METLKPFSLLIKPTSADCNLGCHYCFYLERGGLYPQQTPHRMSDAVVERMISSYMSIPLPSYAFGWQGGEPTLMGVDFFRRVTALQQRHGRRGSIVSNGLQTNATLIDDEFAAHLAEYRFLLGVSVDGPQSVHDTHRVRTSGGGSFDAVMRGIDALQRHEVEFNILVLVSDSNVTRAREVYEFLCAQGYLYHQYIPCVEFDGVGKPLPWTITPQQWGEFLCELFDCWYPTDSRRVSIRCFDALLNYLVNGTYVTCTMGRNCRQYFVVEHNGDIYPCDFFVDKSLRLGSVVTDSWQQLYESAAYRNFGRSKALWNDRCNSCAYLSICSGDCLKHRLFGPTPDPHQLSWLCAGWKRFYDHALPRFEELARTLRAQQPPAAPAPPAAPSPGGASVAGRNEPCLCGSGKKYKKCCGRE